MDPKPKGIRESQGLQESERDLNILVRDFFVEIINEEMSRQGRTIGIHLEAGESVIFSEIISRFGADGVHMLLVETSKQLKSGNLPSEISDTLLLSFFSGILENLHVTGIIESADLIDFLHADRDCESVSLILPFVKDTGNMRTILAERLPSFKLHEDTNQMRDEYFISEATRIMRDHPALGAPLQSEISMHERWITRRLESGYQKDSQLEISEEVKAPIDRDFQTLIKLFEGDPYSAEGE